MIFDASMSIKSLYSDTLLPDIFITEYMPSLDGDYVKVYIQCLFLSKHNKQASMEDLSKVLQLDIKKIKDAFTYFESIGIMTRKNEEVAINDLKEKEIRKIYRLKTTSSPEEAILSSTRNKKRNETIYAINNKFFQGVMSPSWYTDIDAWFDRYKFDDDVMYSLFQHCYDHKGLNKNYIVKVAENWYSKSIKTHFDLENYYIEYQKVRDIRMLIIKKLNLSRRLTEYEEEFIEKWVLEYKYAFEIIELALKKTTAKTNPNFNYIHTVLTDWYNSGLKTREGVMEYEKARKQTAKGKKSEAGSNVPQHGNYRQREYDDEYFNNLYENTGN